MKNLDFLKENIIAHRGLHDNKNGIIENSLESFKKAIEKGYIIELDVRITKDNKVVVYHDDNLNRLAGIDKKIRDLTFEEIKSINLLNTNSKISKIEEVLRLVNGKVPLLIEIKETNKNRSIEKILSKLLESYNGKFAIQSFSPFSLKWFRTNKPYIVRGQLASKHISKNLNFIERAVISNINILSVFSKPDFISYKVADIDIEKVLKIKKSKPILGWTIDNKKDYLKYKSIYTNLICEGFLVENEIDKK